MVRLERHIYWLVRRTTPRCPFTNVCFLRAPCKGGAFRWARQFANDRCGAILEVRLERLQLADCSHRMTNAIKRPGSCNVGIERRAASCASAPMTG